MDLSTADFDAAKADGLVKIDTNGQVFYLLSKERYEQLTQADDSPVTNEELDLLADEADAIISQSETDG
ncbi:MAG: hypothetical protein ABI614_29495, partial [Planctomycetota bacterium]